MDQVEMEQLWSEHLDGEFAAKDVEATLETMTRDPHAARPEAATPCNRPPNFEVADRGQAAA